MTTLINAKIGEAKGVSRIWLEGQKLVHGGVQIGVKYVLRADERAKRIELVPSDRINPGDSVFTVSRRERKGIIHPLLEVRSSILKTFFAGSEKVRVAIRKGRIIVSALQIDLKIAERVDRLKRKLAAKEKLAVGSLFMGGAVLDSAVHSGLLATGLAAFIQVGVELNSDYLDAALRNNPELWNEQSIAINADIRDLSDFEDLPQVDLVCAGIPCTAASRAGVAKGHLKFPEEHADAGSLFVDFLSYVKAANPAAVLVENVYEYASSAGMAVIRSVLKSLGYQLYETVLNGPDFGTIEARRRLCLVAITKGLCDSTEFVFPSTHPSVASRGKVTLVDVLDDVPLNSDSWKSFDYLAAKELRDTAAGKGFKRQLVTSDAVTVGTIGRGYWRVRSTEPQLIHPANPKLSRLFTVNEHARIKGIPEHIVAGLPLCQAHEILGQSVCYPVFQAVGYAIGAAFQGFALPQDYAPQLMLAADDMSETRSASYAWPDDGKQAGSSATRRTPVQLSLEDVA